MQKSPAFPVEIFHLEKQDRIFLFCGTTCIGCGSSIHHCPLNECHHILLSVTGKSRLKYFAYQQFISPLEVHLQNGHHPDSTVPDSLEIPLSVWSLPHWFMGAS